MDPLWLEFRSAPAAYLSSRGLSNQGLVDELLQLLNTPSEKNDVAKLAALGVFQEMAPSLFTDAARLETTVTMLKTVFQQQRTTGSSLICGQILCAMTSMLIEMEDLMDTDYLLLDLVHLLFDVIEKIKSEGNLLLRSTACECLNELEMAYPGLLSSKIGHFYRMSQAENTYIFQHYLLLLANVLKHTLQKYLLAIEQGHTPEFSLNDLLSHAGPLKSYTLPEDLRRQAKQIHTEPPGAVLGEGVESGDVRRAVSFILDCHQLLTPSCLALTLDKVISMVSLSSLAPRMLKSLLLHYLSCQDLLPFHLVLMLKWKFGEKICDQEDVDSIKKWLTTMACHPALPTHHKELLLSLYLQWPQETPLPRNYSEEEMMGGGEEGQEGRWQQVFLPSVFDSYDTYYYKVKALKFQLETEEVLPKSPLPRLLSTVLKQVQYGIEGAPVITLFRLFYAYYSTYPHSVANSDELRKVHAQEEPYYQNGDTVGETDTALKCYLTSLDEGAHQGLSFSLQYQIQFLHPPEGVSPRVYAAVLRLSRSACYHRSPDIYVPYLACKDSEAPLTSSSKIITFTFFPKEPVPVTFSVSATFTTEEGVTCVTNLGDVEVSFEDLLHPLPSTLEVSPSDRFQLLWTDIKASQHPKSLRERFGILSTMHLDIGRKEWEERAKRMQLLQVPNKEKSDEVWYMVFLPPKYHLLFKLRFQDSGVSILLATDCWRGLELVNAYLHDITVD